VDFGRSKRAGVPGKNLLAVYKFMDGKGPLSADHMTSKNAQHWRSIHMLNVTYEDDLKIKNEHVAGVSRTFYLSTETISRPPQSRETIPLK
jgi:hypothetical protein